METKERKVKRAQDAIVNKMNKPVPSAKAENTAKQKAADKQASVQDEFMTSAGEAGTDMSGQRGSEESQRSASTEQEGNSPEGQKDQKSPEDEWRSVRGETGRRYDPEGREQYDPYSEYERGFREGSRHAARWFSERNFEREQNRFRRPNLLEDDYNEVYNPTGMNTERYGGDYGRRERDERRGYRDQRYEDQEYRDRNEDYRRRSYRGMSNRGADYYEESRQSYPNQDRYGYGSDYEDLRRHPENEDQRQGYVDPDREGYEEGGYEYRNRPTRDYYRQEQGLSGRRSAAGHRYGASPGDYERARKDIDYGQRSNYQASESGEYRPGPGTGRDEENRSSQRRRRQLRSGAEWYDDPYRDYDWSSRDKGR